MRRRASRSRAPRSTSGTPTRAGSTQASARARARRRSCAASSGPTERAPRPSRRSIPAGTTGRTVHVHVKVHLGGNVVHTGQLFFPDRITDQVYPAVALQPAGRPRRAQRDRLDLPERRLEEPRQPAQAGSGLRRDRDDGRPPVLMAGARRLRSVMARVDVTRYVRPACAPDRFRKKTPSPSMSTSSTSSRRDSRNSSTAFAQPTNIP